ncbi:hypothetical protein NBRC116601_11930 [Cognatishimia sp. WU-CL00825]|uniref:YciI family protein n=1 Tax=Cognatishimia sp. WU-CL00825 TaxID=3127658 RepID=UPI003103B322
MPRWAVIFTDSADMLDIRADQAKRDAHVAYVRAHPELLIGGGLKPDVNQDFSGALWIVNAAEKADVIKLINQDPFYVPAYRSFEVFTWGKILEDKSVTL